MLTRKREAGKGFADVLRRLREQKTGGNLAGKGERRRMQSLGSLSNGGFERKSFRERKKQENSYAKVKRR